MGLDIHGVRFILHAQKLGVNFQQTAMLGRQTLHLSAGELQRKLKAYGYSLSYQQTVELFHQQNGYAEPLLRLLGAEHIQSFDASNYENATDVHDFNLMIPEEYQQKFSVVLDAGTLEHIFNFPTAIKNCMEMVEIGGHFLSITPANNNFGHGFYQFSPELFYRVLSKASGFQVEGLYVFEHDAWAKWYAVADPDDVRKRVELVNVSPTYIAVIAKKLSHEQLFTQPILQSDYVASWGNEGNKMQEYAKKGRKYMHLVPTCLRTLFRMFERGAIRGFWNRKFYQNAHIK